MGVGVVGGLDKINAKPASTKVKVEDEAELGNTDRHKKEKPTNLHRILEFKIFFN